MTNASVYTALFFSNSSNTEMNITKNCRGWKSEQMVEIKIRAGAVGKEGVSVEGKGK